MRSAAALLARALGALSLSAPACGGPTAAAWSSCTPLPSRPGGGCWSAADLADWDERAIACVPRPMTHWKAVQFSDGVPYRQAFNPTSGMVETLRMDIRTPSIPYALSKGKQPAAVCVHEGGWENHNRRTCGVARVCRWLSQAGFVTATIDYRKLLRGVNMSNLTANRKRYVGWSAVVAAAQDTNAAVRYLKRNADAWNVDTNRVALVGASAGAITSLLVTYGNPRWWSDEHSSYDSRVHAVIAISGAISGNREFSDVIDGRREGAEVPLCVVAGTTDTLVPFKDSLGDYRRAVETGIPNSSLVVMPGLGHVKVKALLEQNDWQIATFLYTALNLRDVCSVMS